MNQPPARGLGSTGSGGRRPRSPSTRSSWLGLFDPDVLLERARYFAARSRPDEADHDFVQAYVLGSRDPKLIEMISRSAALFRRVVAQAPGSAAPLWSLRGDDHARQLRWAESAADYGQAVRLQPKVLSHSRCQMLSQLAAGDLDQFCRARSDLLDRFGPTTVPLRANHAAWYGCVAPGVDTHLESLIRLAELAVNGAPDAMSKRSYPITLGAALYRAGRFEDATLRLEEGIQLRDGMSVTEAWAFLAMAHHHLGHRDQARRYLERLRSRRPSTESNEFWNELEIRLLAGEADSTILYDTVFPADPFAR